VLLLGHAGLPAPECPCLDRDERSFGLAVCLSQGRLQPLVGAAALLHCSSADLPFQGQVFQTVILYLVVGDGSEQELGEACRVLAPGGRLLVVGLNHSGWAGRVTYRHRQLPAMRVARLRKRLRQQGLVVERLVGAGLLGRDKPRMEWRRLSALILPFADLLVLCARHRDSAAMARPGLKKFPAGVVPTAISTV
jgi:SAM-dependent methyltransferase